MTIKGTYLKKILVASGVMLNLCHEPVSAQTDSIKHVGNGLVEVTLDDRYKVYGSKAIPDGVAGAYVYGSPEDGYIYHLHKDGTLLLEEGENQKVFSEYYIVTDSAGIIRKTYCKPDSSQYHYWVVLIFYYPGGPERGRTHYYTRGLAVSFGLGHSISDVDGQYLMNEEHRAAILRKRKEWLHAPLEEQPSFLFPFDITQGCLQERDTIMEDGITVVREIRDNRFREIRIKNGKLKQIRVYYESPGRKNRTVTYRFYGNRIVETKGRHRRVRW